MRARNISRCKAVSASPYIYMDLIIPVSPLPLVPIDSRYVGMLEAVAGKQPCSTREGNALAGSSPTAARKAPTFTTFGGSLFVPYMREGQSLYPDLHFVTDKSSLCFSEGWINDLVMEMTILYANLTSGSRSASTEVS